MQITLDCKAESWAKRQIRLLWLRPRLGPPELYQRGWRGVRVESWNEVSWAEEKGGVVFCRLISTGDWDFPCGILSCSGGVERGQAKEVKWEELRRWTARSCIPKYNSCTWAEGRVISVDLFGKMESLMQWIGRILYFPYQVLSVIIDSRTNGCF